MDFLIISHMRFPIFHKTDGIFNGNMMGKSWNTYYGKFMGIDGKILDNPRTIQVMRMTIDNYKILQVQVHVSAVKENDIENTPAENHFPVGNQTMVHIYVSLLGSEE